MTIATRSAAARGRFLGSVLPPVVAILVILAIWQTVSVLGLVPPKLLPAPLTIATHGWDNRDAILKNTWPTLTATILGFLLSVVVAFVTATILDFFLPLRRAILPLMIVSQTLPIIALAPLVVLWFGFDLLPKVLLVAFVTFFPMAVGLLQGFGAADPDAENLLRSMGAGRVKVFRYIRIHAAAPYFFSGLRVSITYAVVGAIFAEYAGATVGLGVYMQAAKNAFRTDLVLAAVLTSSLLTLALFAIVAIIERLSLPWLRIERGAVPS